MLAFARALGEFGATLTFAGSRQGVTRTLPLEIYLVRESDLEAAVALSILLIARLLRWSWWDSARAGCPVGRADG